MYIERLEAGQDIARSHGGVRAERDRDHGRIPRTDAGRGSDRRSTSSSHLARMVFAYVENHNFYIDHWYSTLFWNKVREFGALLARHALPRPRARTSSYLRHDELGSALEELRLWWSSGAAMRDWHLALAADRGA